MIVGTDHPTGLVGFFFISLSFKLLAACRDPYQPDRHWPPWLIVLKKSLFFFSPPVRQSLVGQADWQIDSHQSGRPVGMWRRGRSLLLSCSDKSATRRWAGLGVFNTHQEGPTLLESLCALTSALWSQPCALSEIDHWPCRICGRSRTEGLALDLGRAGKAGRPP